MNLLLLTFGPRLENHYQAAFCILTFLKDPKIKNVIIITDYPEFYHFFENRINIITVDKSILDDWKGKHDFFWRIKIKALELAQLTYPNEHLIYVDSDTFLATDLLDMSEKLEQNIGFMHVFEYKLATNSKSNTSRKMYTSLNGKNFSSISIDQNTEMWNAGVIALPKDKAKQIIDLSLDLCDEICATDCPRRLVEQFSFSLALKHLTELNSCDNVIGHYWGNKGEWNQYISQFFVESALKRKTLFECIEELKSFNWNSIPLEKKVRSINFKLTKWINKLFPCKNIRFFQ